jgi:hypothetical protein
MTPVTTTRVVLAFAGLAVFGYGIRADLTNVRWVGVALLGVSFLLRFIERRGRR